MYQQPTILCKSLATAIFLSTAITATADAPDGNQKSKENRDRAAQKDKTSEKQSRQNSEQRSDKDGKRSSAQADGQKRYRLDPQGWIKIGTDYNNDGRFDAIETIFLVDLEEAKKRSKARQQQSESRDNRSESRQDQASSRRDRAGSSADQSDRDRMRRPTQRQSDRYQANRRNMDDRGDRSRQMSDRENRDSMRQAMDRRPSDRRDRMRSGDQRRRDDRMQQVSGTIDRMDTLKLAGNEKTYVVAHVENPSGQKTCVVLGPESKLRDWNLEKGDSLRLRGVKAKLNDRTIVMADKVMHEGQSVEIDLPKPIRLKRARGNITDLRTVRFKNFDSAFLVAKLETPNQKRQMVNMGPKSELEKLNLSEGDEVMILSRPGKVNGQTAMIAQEVSAGGQTVKLPRPENTRRFRSGEGNSRARDESQG